ncbi:hypothetical protein [Endozoicomonas numazuensis]|uniref:Uncharacterized protein n=1 Tax=Endozoicomonas numazuensis TaxID=1137799 RepID=A0A081NJ37_9GAMM|nr:hypothetical protein [Endozoicomonas numazuensis]KEQ18460.1 hypothetical protein GZ78_13305 [Endozoicomonas numazuensis]
MSLQTLCADEVPLDSPQQYSFANSKSGLYVNTPQTLYYIPGFSLMRDAISFGANALTASFLDNLDAYIMLATMYAKGITPLSVSQAVANIHSADGFLKLYTVASLGLFYYSYTNMPSAEMVALSSQPKPVINLQFQDFDNGLNITSVYTGQPLFDRQVRINLIVPKPVLRHHTSSPDYDMDFPSYFDKGYSQSLLLLEPTPFKLPLTHNPAKPSERVLLALNMLDGSMGDQILLGKSPEGDLFIMLYLGESGDYHRIWLDTDDTTHYVDDQCDPNAIEQAMEPLNFLFSEAGSQLFSNTLYCFFKNECLNGQLLLQYGNSRSLYSNQTEVELGFQLSHLKSWIYEAASPPPQGIAKTNSKKQVSWQPFSCTEDGQHCNAGLFWDSNSHPFPSIIRVAEGEEVNHLLRHLRKQEDPEKELKDNYPYSLTHPDSFITTAVLVWGVFGSNPLRPILRKLHRRALGAVVRSFLTSSVSTSPLPAALMTSSGLQGVGKELSSSVSLSPLQRTPMQQAMSNFKAQAFYGDMYSGGILARAKSLYKGKNYVHQALGNLYGGRFGEGIYFWLPNQQKGLLWLAYGVTKKDPNSIRMVLEMNDNDHFFQLSGSVTSALKMLLKPKAVPSGKAKYRLKGTTPKSLWQVMLDQIHKDSHDQTYIPTTYRSDMLENTPDIWKDEDFINALARVEKGIDWLEPSKSEVAQKEEYKKETASNSPQHKGRFISRFTVGSRTSSPQSPLFSTTSRNPVIFEKDISKRALEKSGLKIQWLNNAMTEIENHSWKELNECCLVSEQTVSWMGKDYPLYYKSKGARVEENEGGTVTVFFIIDAEQVVILAGGRHPRTTRQNPTPWSQYRIHWTRPGFHDPKFNIGKVYTLPRGSRH